MPVKKARTREKVQTGVPYLAILPFNGCPLLAVGSVEVENEWLLFAPVLLHSILPSA